MPQMSPMLWEASLVIMMTIMMVNTSKMFFLVPILHPSNTIMIKTSPLIKW